jgi:pimeloyl-ACP methyl ester carboxylesterase
MVMAPESHDVSTHAKPIIMLHGACGQRMSCYPQARVLAERYRCVLMDLPGHGTRKNEHLSIESAVAAIDEVVAREVPADQSFLLFGFSMGAYMAAAYAKRRPERIVGLMIGGAGTIYRSPRPALLVAMGAVYRALPASALASLIRRTMGATGSMPKVLPMALERGGQFYGMWDGVVDVMAREDIAASLATLAVPVLLLNGEKDFRSDEARIVAGLRHGTLEVVPGAPHPVPLTHPEETNARLTQWLHTNGF